MGREDFEGLKQFKKEGRKLVEKDRLKYAILKITELGYDIEHTHNEIIFTYKGNTISFFPYTGWASGKGIKDGRGLNKLLKQIKQEQK